MTRHPSSSVIYLSWVLLCLLTGSLVYCLLVLAAVQRYSSVPRSVLRVPYAVSILKPLAGIDLGLEENLRSFFTQDYPSFEILFAVRSEGDPAVAVVRKLRAGFPNVWSEVVCPGGPPEPNCTGFQIGHML